jgi:hypothetical protein
MWLDGAGARRTGMVAIAKPKRFVVATSRCNGREGPGVHGSSRAERGDNYGLERRHAPAQPGWQDLLDFRERAHRRFLDSLNGSGSGAAQTHSDCNGLFVIQQQGRHCRAGAELISAFHTRGRMDRIAKRAEFVNITAQSAASDFEPRGEIGPGPIPAPLKE